jgi:putative endonuclease
LNEKEIKFSVYYVYIVECIDKTLYTGIAVELERRIEEHNTSSKGAKYTRARRPVKLVYSEKHKDRSSASKREYEIKKKMSREDKLKLIMENRG